MKLACAGRLNRTLASRRESAAPGHKTQKDRITLMTCSLDDDELEDKKGPTHSEAYNALNVALEWAERQDECNPMLLLQVKRLRDLAARKRTTATKQKTIKDFFKN